MLIKGKFEKVSRQQWEADIEKYGPKIWKSTSMRNEPSTKWLKAYDQIKLPERKTDGSAGYDFFVPETVQLYRKEGVMLPTGIRCEMEPGWCLVLLPRSSFGIKYGLYLQNTLGLIDSDYYGAENEGHIMTKVVQTKELTLTLGAGLAYVQGVFLPYGVLFDKMSGVLPPRKGGFGSTSGDTI